MMERNKWDGILIVANYNQVSEIGDFLVRVEKHFPKENCIVVDDGSADGSAEVAEKMGFRLIRHGSNRGIGAAIRTGLRFGAENGYRWALISSSNGKIRPEDFEMVYSPVREGKADYVTGSRFMRGGGSPGLTTFRRLAIPVFSQFASLLMGRAYSDITCGFRCYVLELINDPSVHIDQSWLDRYELEYYLHFKATRARKPKKYRIVEVPVTIQYLHISGGRISKIRPFVDWWSMIRPILYLALGLRK